MRLPYVWMCYTAKLYFFVDMQYNWCTLLHTYHFIGKHEYDLCLLLPDHLPKVGAGMLQWTLGHNVLVHSLIHSKLYVNMRDYGAM